MKGLLCHICEGKNLLKYDRIINTFQANHGGNIDKLSQHLNLENGQ